MGFYYGRHTGNYSYLSSAELSKVLRRCGTADSDGARYLLDVMTGELRADPYRLSAQQAGQAAAFLRATAANLRSAHDQQVARSIAADAQEAADAGRVWAID